MRDEAAHGLFGWTFLDWVEDELTDDDRTHLAKIAGRTIDALVSSWANIKGRPEADVDAVNALGWMETDAYWRWPKSHCVKKCSPHCALAKSIR